MAPPPPMPSDPYGEKKKVEFERAGIGPQPGQEEFYRREDNWPGRGYLVRYVGEAIHKAQETMYNIRTDMLIERRVIGRILGKGGRDLEALQLCTGAQVFIIDKYPPPGEGDDHRLIVIIGQAEQVRLCKAKIDQVLERAREELPPLPPPLSSGFRPMPTVGTADQQQDEWVNVGGVKRRADEMDPHESDRRPPPDMRPPGGYDDLGEYGRGPPASEGPTARKVGNCFDWQRGMCSRGDNCKFAHGPSSNESAGADRGGGGGGGGGYDRGGYGRGGY